MNKNLAAIMLSVIMMILLSGCGDDSIEINDASSVQSTEGASWSVYWYLCGSDLESYAGFATMDFGELLEVELPENVQFVIETGGSTEWQNDTVDASLLQRYVYNSEGLFLVDEEPLSSMGDPDTLSDFLEFASTEYPADKTAVIFWDHGGGSVSGVSFDEIYDYDSLTLDEMHEAFESVWNLNDEAPPLELIGFDACLMATVDVADTFSDIARYLVASEETEPANGWNYEAWARALADDPYMDGASLGRVICDTYYDGCEEYETEDSATLSLIDLGNIGPLLTAYESYGAEALLTAYEEPSFFSQFGRAAEQSENYGGNTKEQGYSNMVDLGDLARQTAWLMPSAQDVLDALDNCVLYHIGGPYRTQASGLSCYYSYNGDIDELSDYIDIGSGSAFKYLYSYALTGELDYDGMQYLSSLTDDVEVSDELPEIINLLSVDWDGAPLDLDDEGSAFLTLGTEADSVLTGIDFMLFYLDEEDDLMLLLGTDNDIYADWDEGVFYENFRGVWGSIDGCLVYMELSYEGDDYNLYSVPILLNDEEYNLQVAYDFIEEEWSILGARSGIDDNGMAGKELRLLAEGDEITTIWYASSISGDDDFEAYAIDTIEVTADTEFAEIELMDGTYSLVFEMKDAMGNYALSEAAYYECADGEIYTTVYTEAKSSVLSPFMKY